MTLQNLFILFCFLPCASFGQDNAHLPDIKLGTVWFQDNSIRLTDNAKMALDPFVGQIQNDTSMNVQAVTYNKDICDKCGVRSWKRASRVLKYLSKHGVSTHRLAVTNRLDGELNKVDLYLTSTEPNGIPAKTFRRQNKR